MCTIQISLCEPAADEWSASQGIRNALQITDIWAQGERARHTRQGVKVL